MSKLGSYDPFEYLQHKLWPKEGPRIRVSNWLPTTKSQDYMCVRGVPHIVGKLSTKAITFFEITFQSKGCTRSYGHPKWWEFKFWELQDSQFGSPGKYSIWM
jgi:hypothetical protein